MAGVNAKLLANALSCLNWVVILYIAFVSIHHYSKEAGRLETISIVFNHIQRSGSLEKDEVLTNAWNQMYKDEGQLRANEMIATVELLFLVLLNVLQTLAVRKANFHLLAFCVTFNLITFFLYGFIFMDDHQVSEWGWKVPEFGKMVWMWVSFLVLLPYFLELYHASEETQKSASFVKA